MEKIKTKDLVVGEFYYDDENSDLKMQLVKKKKGSVYFKYISGINKYTEEDELIEFNIEGLYGDHLEWYKD